MRFTRSRKFYAGAVLAALGLWIVGALAYSVVANALDNGDPPCFTDTFRAPPVSPSQPVIDLGQTTEKLTLAFGQGRGRGTDEAQIDTRANPPSPLQVDSTGLRGSAGTIDGSDVQVRARLLRGTLLVDACLDLRTTGRVRPGTYTGKVIFTDPRVSDLTVPITATVQARYLMFLMPFVLVLPALGLFLVWQAVSSDDRAKFGSGALAAYLTAVGITAVAFSAQGLSNPGWGGLVPAAALIGGMYTAALGATASFISKAKKENPAP